MTIATLTLALDRYERHVPLFDRRVAPPDGFDFALMEVGQEAALRHGRHRHERMLRDGEFDVAELSLSSYLIAVDRGLPVTAVPVFPRRLFSQTQMFVRADSALEHPRDLAGKRVALQSFQTTLAVLAKGDLAFEYGVPWPAVRWHVRDSETLALADRSEAPIVRLAADADLARLLADGEVDALFYSRFPRTPSAPDGTFRRLFRNPRDEAGRYWRKHGWFPIMHVLALRTAVAERHPELPAALMRYYAAAMTACRDQYDDPGWSYLPAGRLDFEDARAIFGDAWPSGLAANRANLARFIDYARDQGLIGRPVAVEELFHPSTHAT
ncbi:MAG: PhnD/SsuA/transferrin family substrate-binding protein [Rhodospirillales bacterium]